jgi:hypothetical protein
MIQNEFQNRLRRYLLGELADDARDEIEQDLLIDEELFEELLVMEEELTDEYIEGNLANEERARFEQHFLATPERQQSLRFARALNRYLTTHASERGDAVRPIVPGFLSRQSRSFSVGAAVAVIVIMAGALWFFFLRQHSPPTFTSLTLTISANTRDEGVQAPKIKLLGEETLRIYLKLPNPPPSAVRYRAQLLDVNGESRSLKIAGQEAQSVILEIPGPQLRRGQYALNLSAIKADGTEQRINGSYYFTVE